MKKNPEVLYDKHHSRVGVVSFILALGYCLIMASIKLAGSYFFDMNEYTGLITFLLIGLGLGFMGTQQRKRNQLFPQLSLIIYSAFLVTTIYEIINRFSNSQC